MGRDGTKPPVRGKTSPYGFFVKMCYEEHKKKYPNENVQVTEISKKCSEKWKTMTDDEKRRFFELAQKDAERYHQEMEQYGGEDAFRKRKKVKKDPNAPKRALSAFFFFSQVKRQEVVQEHPDWKVGQVAQELGRMWKALTDEQKKVYETMATNDKARYENDMKDFKAGTYKAGPSNSTAQPSGMVAGVPQPQQLMANASAAPSGAQTSAGQPQQVKPQPQQPQQPQQQMQQQMGLPQQQTSTTVDANQMQQLMAQAAAQQQQQQHNIQLPQQMI